MSFFSSLKKLLDIEDKPEDEKREREELGITDELLAFVKNISKYPESFKDFPMQTLSSTPFRLSSLQTRHVSKIITLVEPLNALRFSLCPSHMKDDIFWRIYFIHISKVTPQIFDSDEIISTPVPSSSLDELDSQLDKLAANLNTQYDQGINEDEDNYWSDNIYIDRQLKERSIDDGREAEVPVSDLVALKKKILSIDNFIRENKLKQQNTPLQQQQPVSSPSTSAISTNNSNNSPSVSNKANPGFLDDFLSSIIK